MAIESPKHMRRGRRNPLLLSPRLNYLLFGTFFAGNITVLVALISAAGKNREVLASIARSAEASEIRQQERTTPAPVEKIPAPVGEDRRPSPDSLRVSLPTGWEWRGCLADSGSVEILMSPSPRSP